MVALESLGTVSYSHFIVTAAVSCINFEIKRDIGRKSQFFSYVPAYVTFERGRVSHIVLTAGPAFVVYAYS